MTWATRRLDSAIPALFLLPFFLLFLDSNWLFSDIYNDPWIYFGFYLNLPAHLRAFNGLYYADRLTITIPGYLFHRLFPDVMAHCLLHLGLNYVSLFSIYLTLRATVGRRPAFLAALAMGTHSFFLKAVGWDYFDGYTIAYLCMTIFLVVVGCRTQRRTAFFLAGVTAAALVAVNVALGLFLAPVALIAIGGRDHRHGRFSLFEGLLWGCAGGLALVALLEAVHIGCTGKLWTLEGTRRFIAYTGGRHPTEQTYAVSEWGWQACWLVFPALMTLASLLDLARRRSGHRVQPGADFPAMMLTTVGLCLAFSFVVGPDAYFQRFFYSNMLLPVSFLTLGDQLRRPLELLTRRQFLAVAAFAATALASADALPSHELSGSRFRIPMAVVALAPGIPAVLLLGKPRRLALCCASFACLGLSTLLARQGFRTWYCAPPSLGFIFRGNCFDHDRIDLLRTVASVTRFVLEVEPEGHACFWYELDEPFGLVFKAIGCTHCDTFRTVSYSFPWTNGKIIRGEPLRPGKIVVVLTSFKESSPVISAATSALAKFGVTGRLVRTRDFSTKLGRFQAIVLQIAPLSKS